MMLTPLTARNGQKNQKSLLVFAIGSVLASAATPVLSMTFTEALTGGKVSLMFVTVTNLWIRTTLLIKPMLLPFEPDWGTGLVILRGLRCLPRRKMCPLWGMRTTIAPSMA